MAKRVINSLFLNKKLFIQKYFGGLVSRSFPILINVKHSPFTCVTRSFCSTHNETSTGVYDFDQEFHNEKKSIGKIQPKLFLAFTCKNCNARIEKHISKLSYTKGVVIVRCDGCEENHLIADNLGWFPHLKSMRNIEDFMEAQGEVVKKTLEGNAHFPSEENDKN